MRPANSMERMKVAVSGESFVLRPIEIGDIDALHALDCICFPPDRAFTPGYFSLLFLYHRAFGWALEDPEAELAAFILLTIQRNRGNISTIDVHPRFRRLGLGTRLIGLAEETLRQMGVRKCALQVEVDNEAAIELYKKLGYSTTRLLPGYYDGKKDGYLMEKPLGGESQPSAEVV
ncbi:MAG TPA: N-acetyltransferase [Acidobacteriota bacterium]|nr:N-acetyltransferase [Acidobacteriota bacterium]